MSKAQEHRDAVAARAAAWQLDLYLMSEAWARGQRTYKPAVPCRHHPEAERYVPGLRRRSPRNERRCVQCVRLKVADQKLRRDLGDLY